MKSLCLLSLFLLGNIPVTLGQSVKTPVANDNIHLEQELERRSNSKYLFTQALLDQKEARRTVVPEYSTSTFNFGKLNPQP